MSKSELYVDLKYEPYIFRSDPNMCNRSPNMSNFMDKKPMKNRQDLKPTEIRKTTQESNKELTSELRICIVF